jgi:hypothetical protein
MFISDLSEGDYLIPKEGGLFFHYKDVNACKQNDHDTSTGKTVKDSVRI